MFNINPDMQMFNFLKKNLRMTRYINDVNPDLPQNETYKLEIKHPETNQWIEIQSIIN